MISYFKKWAVSLVILCYCQQIFSQNSILINFGTDNCLAGTPPSFSLIKDPLGNSPSVITTCDLALQLPDIFSVFVAYNPKNNQIYIADNSSGLETKIWAMDMGLPRSITCPGTIPVAPNYSYPYISNNFEFDNNGDLWSFSNYDPASGMCNMDKFDVTTGNIINTRTLQFPVGNYPTAITSGDLTILPNGRMFATLGSSPSQLYEIFNYSSTSQNATAAFLDTIPLDCYGIAYLNGVLEIAGTDFGGNCYFFKYDIASKKLAGPFGFQGGQLPIDNTSITASTGVTKQLVKSVRVTANTADITYEIFVKNLGNVALNNINVTEDLGAVFGAANISNVSASFLPGANSANLQLNNSFDGKTNTLLLAPNQTLPNQTSINDDYYFKIRLSLRVNNLVPVRVYWNSAIASGNIGGTGSTALISVKDSSNNGPQEVVDPNNNGYAGDAGENVPTPFILAILPVKFISVQASPIADGSVLVQWTVATPVDDARIFEIEFSRDGIAWEKAGEVLVKDKLIGSYQFTHEDIYGTPLFYRIKETDIDGEYIYSNIVSVRGEGPIGIPKVYPVPAIDLFTVIIPQEYFGGQVMLYNGLGQILEKRTIVTGKFVMTTANLPAGTYLLNLQKGSKNFKTRILVRKK